MNLPPEIARLRARMELEQKIEGQDNHTEDTEDSDDPDFIPMDKVLEEQEAVNPSDPDHELEIDPESPIQEPVKLEAEGDVQQEVQDTLMIYNTRCLTCSHLFSRGTKTYNKCHFSAGNDNCPARYVKIVVGVNVQRAAQAVVTAWSSGDPKKISDLMLKVAALDKEVAQRVLETANSLLRK